VASSAQSVAELGQGSRNALPQGDGAALGQSLADGEQCVSRQAGLFAATVDDGRADTHLRFLLRGALAVFALKESLDADVGKVALANARSA
jgi:hypothetical protein